MHHNSIFRCCIINAEDYIALLKKIFHPYFIKMCDVHAILLLPRLFLKRVMYICLMDVILACVINVKMKIYML